MSPESQRTVYGSKEVEIKNIEKKKKKIWWGNQGKPTARKQEDKY